MKALKFKLLAATSAFAVIAGLAPAKADKFPEKPIEMTILFGSTAQTIGQLLADLMSKHLPQPVVPVSRTGGGGSIGYQHVHSSAPDGYSIVWNSNSISTTYHGGRLISITLPSSRSRRSAWRFRLRRSGGFWLNTFKIWSTT